MKCSKLYLIVITLLVSVHTFSQENVFLNRDFWSSKPTVEVVDSKIKEGNNPSEANGSNFDGVVYSILQDAPIETIKYLQSQKGNDPNKLTHDGRTYIFWAAYKGNVEIMEYLLKQGAKTDLTDDKGNTILNFAASSGQQNTKVYDLCLENGANLKNDVTPNGANALLLVAPSDENFALINYFQSKGLDINSVDNNGNGVFNYVARTGNTSLLNQLLEKGVKGNNQAFIFAAYGARGKANGIEVYKYLETKNLDPKASNEEGASALHILASRSKDVEIINFLLEKGLDVNQEDHYGNTAFMNAASRNNLEIVKLLSESLKDINHANKKGETALAFAVQRNDTEVVTFLINRGAKTDVVDTSGNNLNYYLVDSYSTRNKEQFSDKLNVLKNKGFKLETPQNNGNTWYHLAVEKSSIDLLEIAAKMNQDVNAKNSEGNTALHLAAMKAQNENILKFLLNEGAKKELETEFEETAYDLAQENELLKKNNISIEFLK
ncbi:Ankyrin repeat [Flaviramulus basaltis]|uniref:Ankyrin repeat n=1 Tax=Flaviramulus basaltis TaxID=369401 RepID=A0A1K2IDU3_9FLAO|nr:ankyrin repeat domain-containing protein [Flaviramulus basaltis]SFZ90464.1 Ankyrin repeat [Flaviramulus basaltis]